MITVRELDLSGLLHALLAVCSGEFDPDSRVANYDSDECVSELGRRASEIERRIAALEAIQGAAGHGFPSILPGQGGTAATVAWRCARRGHLDAPHLLNGQECCINCSAPLTTAAAPSPPSFAVVDDEETMKAIQDAITYRLTSAWSVTAAVAVMDCLRARAVRR